MSFPKISIIFIKIRGLSVCYQKIHFAIYSKIRTSTCKWITEKMSLSSHHNIEQGHLIGELFKHSRCYQVVVTVIESGGLFFLASPRGPETAGSFREDIASYPATPRQLLSAALASAPREPGERISAAARRLRPEGETTRGPNGGLIPAPLHVWGQIALTPNHQRGSSRWLIAKKQS